MFREIAILQTAKFVKNTAGFLACLIMAFMLSRYNMPLYPVTSWLVDHSYQYFSHYQADVYEPGSRPRNFRFIANGYRLLCPDSIILFQMDYWKD